MYKYLMSGALFFPQVKKIFIFFQILTVFWSDKTVSSRGACKS